MPWSVRWRVYYASSPRPYEDEEDQWRLIYRICLRIMTFGHQCTSDTGEDVSVLLMVLCGCVTDLADGKERVGVDAGFNGMLE